MRVAHVCAVGQVSSATSFSTEDLSILTTVTLENVWDNTLFDVQYQRTMEPNQEQVRREGHEHCCKSAGSEVQ